MPIISAHHLFFHTDPQSTCQIYVQQKQFWVIRINTKVIILSVIIEVIIVVYSYKILI